MSRLSVIVSTFDRPDALARVIEGHGACTVRDFELIVADDGSGPATAELVRRLAPAAGFELRHVWQPHRGFRLAAARNLAARQARGEILVFTDGDCVPFPGALEAHLRLCRPGRAVTGERCLLEEDETTGLLAGAALSPELFERARRRELPRLRWQRWKTRWYRLSRLKPRPKLLAANAAVHRVDFERANGFDERFVGWGYEDEDLARRLRRLGGRVVDATCESLVLHLFHPVHESHRPSARASANYEYFRRGAYLTRPLRGLARRAVEELAVEWLGPGAAPAGLRTCPAGARPEVSLLAAGAGSQRRPQGELTVVLPESLRSAPGAAVREWLAAQIDPGTNAVPAPGALDG